MIRAGIIGGAGYTAGELIRLLINHPRVEIAFVHSVSNAGNLIWQVHEGLFGDTDLRFSDAVSLEDVDVLFLCSAHGDSVKWLDANSVPESVRIIDLSQDFRDESRGFVYGLPEINRDRTAGTRLVANPGCFATSIQLGLLPAAQAGAINGEVHVTALTGSTGAGVKPTSKTHFSWRTDNISTYKEFTHQHLLEIGRTISHVWPSTGTRQPEINFVPMRGDFARGIFASIYFDTDLDEDSLKALYCDYYHDAAFTFVCPVAIDLKQVVNTNKAILHVEKHGNKAHITVAIDNLLKGASGQAVQNMNLMFGLDERTGLRLKASAF